MNYKTPGVYVEEHSKFPPSVAQVETAIPAFIGYTAEGPKNKPTKISSMLDYENLFGKANPEVFAVAFEDGSVKVTQPKVSDFKMYYAMQMYFANGGGACYIVSVGAENVYYSSVNVAELQAGLDLLKKEDEPTLIVFPDLQGLVSTSADKVSAQAVKTAAQYAFDVANAAVGAAEDALENAVTPEELEQAEQALADAEADADTADEIVLLAAANFDKINAANIDGSIATVYQLYNKALDQAELLKDRFVIMDVLGDDVIFRDKVSATGLKYGAAYHPKLKTVLSYNFDEAEVFVTPETPITNTSASSKL